MAHELGHAIQARADVRGATILLELQADCFAGAWTADVEAGNAEHFTVDLADLEASIAGFLELRDGIGVDPLDDRAHGTAFDRIGAFQDGYENGATRCGSYEREPPQPTERAFTSLEDFERGGNLPLDQIVDLAVEDLEDFYSLLLPELGAAWDPIDALTLIDRSDGEVSCDGTTLSDDELEYASFYCVEDDTIYVDGDNLVPELNGIGDFAVATEIARNYAFAAQAQAGIDGTERQLNLHADCLSGLWSGTTFPDVDTRPSRSLVLSPGDLDEAIIAFLSYGDSVGVPGDDESSGTGTAFERVDAFRTGFFEGVTACDEVLSG
jgi:predicted metalloprotease